MAAEKCVVVNGRSLFSLALEATLSEQTSLNVIRPATEQELQDGCVPDLIVVEANGRSPLLSHHLLVPVLVLDVPNGRVTLIQQEQRPIHNMNDLVKIIIHLAEATPFAPELIKKDM